MKTKALIALCVLMFVLPAMAGDEPVKKVKDNLDLFITVGTDAFSAGARWKYFGVEVGQHDDNKEIEAMTYEALGFVPFKINNYPLHLKLGLGLSADDTGEVVERQWTGSIGVNARVSKHLLLGVGYSGEREYNILAGYSW